MKSPEDKKRWIVDEEAARVVQRIFALCLEGFGPTQIAKMLKSDKVLCPPAYWVAQGRKVVNPIPDNPHHWHSDTVATIWEQKEYLGHTVNFKTYRASYKQKKKRDNPAEKHLVFENTNETVVDVGTWEKVQELRKHKRRLTKNG